jgi:ribosomal protein S18 acetylase RimI-like enzyme
MNLPRPKSVTVRPAAAPDIPLLSALARATYAETFGPSMTAAELDWQLRHTRSEAYFRRRIGKDTILVAVSGRQVVGYVQISDATLPLQSPCPGDQQVHALYVARRHQGKGLGRQLMDAALALPRIQSATNLYLDVWRENARALGFYVRYGFEVIGECDVVVDAKVVGRDLIMRRRSTG